MTPLPVRPAGPYDKFETYSIYLKSIPPKHEFECRRGALICAKGIARPAAATKGGCPEVVRI